MKVNRNKIFQILTTLCVKCHIECDSYCYHVALMFPFARCEQTLHRFFLSSISFSKLRSTIFICLNVLTLIRYHYVYNLIFLTLTHSTDTDTDTNDDTRSCTMQHNAAKCHLPRKTDSVVLPLIIKRNSFNLHQFPKVLWPCIGDGRCNGHLSKSSPVKGM